LDTSKYYIYYNTLSRKNVIYPAALDLVDKNRADFQKKYTDFKTFNDKFEVTDEMVNKILDDGEKEGVKKDEKSVTFARPLLKKQVKGLIARDLFSVSEYFEVMNADDEAIKKAAQILSKRGEYEKILEGKEK
jgi:carboxyl-terminal processing protease